MFVVSNVSKPESTLNKKSTSICYHGVHETVSMGEDLVAQIITKKNIVDLFTKVLFGQNSRIFVDMILGDMFPNN